ncbi:MAG: UDP-N-acetylmuramoyl-L-alanine--D-glutamate ligase [Lachnospiraceae bacterium]
MEWNHKTVLVIGTGISGISAVGALLRVQACPILFDENTTLQPEKIQTQLPTDREVPLILGELPEKLIDKIELVILSPGVPLTCQTVILCKQKHIPIWGEIELAYQLSKGAVLAITGTNGKTTTTSLLGQIMSDTYDSVYIVGNIGNPYTDIVADTTEDSITVAEISSFQLETIHSFRPKISAILNITPDHLNRHKTMEHYIALKESIAKNQTAEDTVVLNYEDPYTQAFGKITSAQVLYFSSQRTLERGIYLKDETIWLADGIHNPILVMNIHDMSLMGLHNVENVMAAIGMAYSYGVPLTNIVATVRAFRAVEHRIEYVATKKGVDYYNDSKGTNPDAAIKGIQAMNKPTYLIGGGYDKQNEYDAWIEAFDGKVQRLVLIGQTREQIATCAREHGFMDITMADTLEEAMKFCEEHAKQGEAVLLSPACASWGMFPNYEVRGQQFKDYVNQIKE